MFGLKFDAQRTADEEDLHFLRQTKFEKYYSFSLTVSAQSQSQALVKKKSCKKKKSIVVTELGSQAALRDKWKIIVQILYIRILFECNKKTNQIICIQGLRHRI